MRGVQLRAGAIIENLVADQINQSIRPFNLALNAIHSLLIPLSAKKTADIHSLLSRPQSLLFWRPRLASFVLAEPAGKSLRFIDTNGLKTTSKTTFIRHIVQLVDLAPT
jgi:hypothetical protein